MKTETNQSNIEQIIAQIDAMLIPNEEHQTVLRAIKEKEIARNHNDINSVLFMVMISAFNYGCTVGKREERQRRKKNIQAQPFTKTIGVHIQCDVKESTNSKEYKQIIKELKRAKSHTECGETAKRHGLKFAFDDYNNVEIYINESCEFYYYVTDIRE